MVTFASVQPSTTYDGYDYVEACRILADRGATIVGLNCSRGPETMLPLLEAIRAAVDVAVAAQPVPYRTSPAAPAFEALAPADGLHAFPIALEPFQCTRFEMADFALRARDIGVDYIGICCGGGPHHVRAMAEALGRDDAGQPLLAGHRAAPRPRRADEPHGGHGRLGRRGPLGGGDVWRHSPRHHGRSVVVRRAPVGRSGRGRAGADYVRDVDIRHRIVILGGGTGGTLTANRLRAPVRRRRARSWSSTTTTATSTSRGCCSCPSAWPTRRRSSARAARSCTTASSSASPRSTASRPHADAVHLVGGETLAYDVLVVASGASLLPEETEGLTGPGWGERIFTFYELERRDGAARGAAALRRRPARGQRGRHADQVPGRAAGVLLPGRLVLPRARHPRRRRADLRDAARRRVHQAGRRPSTSPGCWPRRASSW